MIPVWLPVAVPWAGAALLLALPRRPVLAGPAVAAASLAAAVALAATGGAARPDALGSALLLAGAFLALLVVLADARAASEAGSRRRDDRFLSAGFPLLQGGQALALLAAEAAVAWIGLAVGAGAGAALVARSGGRRAAVAAWRVLLLCGAGLALALLGVALLHGRAAAAAGGPRGSAGLGFVLLLLGYGALAGLAPLNAWLPRAMRVSAPPVAAALAGLLLPAALHALLRAAATAGPASGSLPPAALLAAVGLATALLAALAAWRRPASAVAARELPGWSAAGLAGLAAVGFGLGGAAGELAGALLLLSLPFSVGAAALGAAAGGPVAALGRASAAGVPPFAPFVALVLLLSAAAALPAALALPLGAALLLSAAGQLGAAARGRGRGAAGRGGLLVSAPPWVLLGLALALGAALPERVAGALAEAARLVR